MQLLRSFEPENNIVQPVEIKHLVKKEFKGIARNINTTVTKAGLNLAMYGSGIMGIKLDMAGLRVPFESSAFTAGGIVANASDVSQIYVQPFSRDNKMAMSDKSVLQTLSQDECG